MDENGVTHFLSEYLCKLHPPLTFQDPLHLFRMIYNVMFESDTGTR